MFVQDEYSMNAFPFGDAIKDWQDRKEIFVIDDSRYFHVYWVFLHTILSSSCNLCAIAR
jgi:hypothetical protein